MLGRGAEAAAAAAAAEKERKRDRERGRSRRSGFIGDPDGFRFRGYVEREERTGAGADGGRVSSIHARARCGCGRRVQSASGGFSRGGGSWCGSSRDAGAEAKVESWGRPHWRRLQVEAPAPSKSTTAGASALERPNQTQTANPKEPRVRFVRASCLGKFFADRKRVLG